MLLEQTVLKIKVGNGKRNLEVTLDVKEVNYFKNFLNFNNIDLEGNSNWILKEVTTPSNSSKKTVLVFLKEVQNLQIEGIEELVKG